MLNSLMRDKVTLVKKDGTVAKTDMKASVSNGRIITFDTSLAIETGDHFLRQLPNGSVEDYEILDPNFLSGFGGIQDSYQSHVRRTSLPTAAPQTVINNINNSAVGVINTGTVGDIHVTMSNRLDMTKVKDFAGEVANHLDALPDTHKAAVMAELDVINAELTKPVPHEQKIKSSVFTIQKIATDVGTSLVAKGIVGLAMALLGGGHQ